MNRSDARTQTRRYTQLPRYFRWFSDHCVLRQLDDSDAARILDAVLQPALEPCGTLAPPRTAAEVARFVRSAQTDWQRGTRYAMALVRKQTHEFVGWVELRATADRATWVLDWFVHPRFAGCAIAGEALTAAADLMFSALDAQRLLANCPPRHTAFERLLNDAGFIELAPAGSVDRATGRPRPHAVHELGRSDWLAMCREREALPSPTIGATFGRRMELALA
ncbi:MAG: GNAT family N-acetyltransferase [Burkholderiaceae bacterium]